MGKKKHTRKSATRKLKNKARKLAKRKKIQEILQQKKRLNELNISDTDSSNDSLPPFVDIEDADPSSVDTFCCSESDINSSSCDPQPVNSTDKLQNLPGYEAAKQESFSKDPLEIGYLMWRTEGRSKNRLALQLERAVSYSKSNFRPK